MGDPIVDKIVAKLYGEPEKCPDESDFTDDELDTIELACDVLIDRAWRYSGAASAVKDKVEAIRAARTEIVEEPT